MLSLKASHAEGAKIEGEGRHWRHRGTHFSELFLGVWQHKGVDTFCVDSYWALSRFLFQTKTHTLTHGGESNGIVLGVLGKGMEWNEWAGMG